MRLSLLLRGGFRHFVRHPLQTALAVLGVALGLAVVVAIEVTNRSALEAFRLSSQSVTGRATHQIVGDSSGLPEELYRLLRVRSDSPTAAPVVELHLRPVLDATRSLRILGVDPLADAEFRSHIGVSGVPLVDLSGFILGRGAIIARTTADELGVAIGDALALRTPVGQQSVLILGFFTADDDVLRQATADLVVVDIGTAQQLGALTGRLTRIDLLIPEGDTRQKTISEIERLLPPGTGIERPETRSAAAEEMTRAFRLNLRALSLLGLLCGAFLIYNTMTFAVVQRRDVLGILRALGVTRREIFFLVAIEALGIGAAGSMLGVFSGRFLADILVTRVTQTINDLYFTLSVQAIEVPTAVLVTAFLVGILTTMAAALGPALEATTASPRTALDRSELEARVHRAVPRLALTGLALIGVGLAALTLPGETLVAAFAGLFLVLLGLSLLSPGGIVLLMAALTPASGLFFGGLGRMATRGVTRALSRTGVAVAALMMAVAVTIGVDVMIGSFRKTVDTWLRQVLPADLYVTTPGVFADRFATATAVVTPRLLKELGEIDGVVRIDTVRHARARSSIGPVPLLAYDLGERGRDAFLFKAGEPGTAWEALMRGQGTIVTEPFASRHDLVTGSRLELYSPTGPVRLEVVGIVFDYATEEGRVLVDHSLYERFWDDGNRTAASLWLLRDADPAAVRRQVLLAAGSDLDITVRSNGELRAESMRVFDRTFLVTDVLRLLAVVVAFIGVLAALTALQLERRRELALLRASGLTPRQVWSVVTSQTGLMGLTAGLFSLPVGVVMAWILVHVINRRSFGWSLETTIEPGTLIFAIALSLTAALVAGLLPAWHMARVPPADALRGD